jgi:Flp pilus assembly protein TadG
LRLKSFASVPLQACRRLGAEQRGAALAEFIVAMPVLLLAYLSFLQMAHVYAASLVMRHATAVLARYASVSYGNNFIATEDQATGGDNPSWRDAAIEALGPWKTVVTVRGEPQVRFQGGTRDPWGDIETRAEFQYTCSVPMAKDIVCRNGVVIRSLQAVSPLHGARYIHRR